jgi:hypothetical protein
MFCQVLKKHSRNFVVKIHQKHSWYTITRTEATYRNINYSINSYKIGGIVVETDLLQKLGRKVGLLSEVLGTLRRLKQNSF